MRTCKQCGHTGELNDFPKVGHSKHKTYYRYVCKKCYVSNKIEAKKRKRDFIWEIKKKSICKMCGISDWRVLEFHHKDDDKERNIADMLSFSKESILSEIEKCDVLCANCHRIVHFEERLNLSVA